ncbi:MAG: hypothetical protein ABIJ16_02670 [Bacteroidota bacterium]
MAKFEVINYNWLLIKKDFSVSSVRIDRISYLDFCKNDKGYIISFGLNKPKELVIEYAAEEEELFRKDLKYFHLRLYGITYSPEDWYGIKGVST